MKRFLVVVVALMALVIGYLALFPVGQQPDRTFDTRLASPAYSSRHPLVLFDEAHYNAHTLNGGYGPFGQLLQNDGYELRRNGNPFSADGLAGVTTLVIVNAAGGSNPKLFGFNLVPLRRGRRDAPAFTPAEIETIRKWVSNGGSLLLVADHYPFGPSSSALAAAFGVTMHGGFAEVPVQYRNREDSGAIEFTRANGLLPAGMNVAGTNNRQFTLNIMHWLSRLI